MSSHCNIGSSPGAPDRPGLSNPPWKPDFSLGEAEGTLTARALGAQPPKPPEPGLEPEVPRAARSAPAWSEEPIDGWHPVIAAHLAGIELDPPSVRIHSSFPRVAQLADLARLGLEERRDSCGISAEMLGFPGQAVRMVRSNSACRI